MGEKGEDKRSPSSKSLFTIVNSKKYTELILSSRETFVEHSEGLKKILGEWVGSLPESTLKTFVSVIKKPSLGLLRIIISWWNTPKWLL